MVWPCQPSILCLCICICMMPFRQLLKPNTPFIWNNQLEEIFQKSKQTIVNEIEESVRIFNETRPTCLVTDWSKTGIGFWLLQKPLLKIFGDRSLNDIENLRLRKLKEKTLQYRFKMVHLPGARNKAEDAVSHHPTDTD